MIQLKEPGVKLTPRNTDATKCVQDLKILAGSFYLYRIVPIKLGKVIKSEGKKMMYLQTLNIECGQIVGGLKSCSVN